MNRLFTSSVALIVLLLSAGCASVGHPIDQDKLNMIVKGASTKADVIAHLGQPNQYGSDSDGRVTLTYIYSSATTKGETFIPIYGAFAGGMNVQSQTVIVVIGPNGKVERISQNSTALDANSGVKSDIGPVMPK